MMDTNRQIVALWTEAITAEGLTLSSVDTYQYDADCYLRFLDSHRLALASVTRQDLRAYLISLTLAPATIEHRRAVLGSLHRFMCEEGIAGSDPASLLEPMRRGQTLPHCISQDDVTLLLDTAHTYAGDSSVGLYRQAGYARRAALLETLYASGMRVSEAVTLRYKQIRGDHATITGKGSKERIVMFNEPALAAIERWYRLVNAYQRNPREFVFHQTKNFAAPLTRNSAFKEIQAVAVLAGIRNPKDLSPHALRHAFASHLLHNGVDLRVLQEMLGHADIASTEIYTHILDHRKKNMVRDLHPMMDSYD